MLAAEVAVTGFPDQVMAEQEEVAVEEPVEIEPVHQAQLLPLILAAVAEAADHIVKEELHLFQVQEVQES
jgi:hypothetical protein